MCQHMWTCRHVLIGADMCWHVPTCPDMCRHVPTCDITLGTHDINHFDIICILLYVLICADICWYVASFSASLMPTIWILAARWHVSAHVDMPTRADMCRYVPTCSITLGTSDTNQLNLIFTLACGSACGHADMCYVPTCADMCRHVLICANMQHHSWHLWYQPFEPYLHAGMCQHMWTCRHVLICADI